MNPPDALRERLAACGALRLDAFMEWALTDPQHGYYPRRDPLGQAGDFTTAPEISQIFGELAGIFLAGQWLAMGRPRAVLAEAGPGRGTLMADLLRATRHVTGFHDAVRVALVEISVPLRTRQQRMLQGLHPRITWHNAMQDLPDGPLLLAANEFFDALPVRQHRRTADGWQERHVTLKVGEPRLTWLPGEAPPHAPEHEGIHETCPQGETLARWLGARLAAQGGSALIIDYGYAQAPQGGDTLQAVRRHAFAPPLEAAGNADLTAHVDFGMLARAAGVPAYGPLPQGEWLRRMGAPLRLQQLCRKATPEQQNALISGLARLTSPDQMGTLFQVQCLSAPDLPPPPAFTETP